MICLSHIDETLNKLLVRVFNDILSIEEKMLTNDAYKDLTMNDMHVIEVIGCEGERNMSSIAKDAGVTVGTLTISMNSLVKKGYVIRARSEKDRRVVLIKLSDKGIKAFNHHKEFHNKMIKEITELLDENETRLLANALEKIDNYFKIKKL